MKGQQQLGALKKKYPYIVKHGTILDQPQIHINDSLYRAEATDQPETCVTALVDGTFTQLTDYTAHWQGVLTNN